MKSVLVLVVVISAQVYGGLLDQLNINLAGNIGSCATLKGITPDKMVALSTLQSPTDTPTQCFLACVAKQQGIMKMDNTFDRATVTNVMKPLVDILSIGKGLDATQVTNSIADACTTLPPITDECEAAKQGFDCFVQTAKTNGL